MIMFLLDTISLNGGSYWNGYCEWGGYYLSRLPTVLSALRKTSYWLFSRNMRSSPNRWIFISLFTPEEEDGETALSFSSRKMSFWFVATPRSIMSCLKIEGYKENTYCGKKNPTMISAIRLNTPSIAVLQIDLKLWCDWELFKLLTYQIAIVGELCNFAILQSSLLPKSLLTNNLNWFWYKQLEAIIGQECDTHANYWPCNWWSLG